MGLDALDLLSPRAYNLLVLNGCTQLSQVVAMSREELAKLPRLDAELAGEIAQQCRRYCREMQNTFLAALPQPAEEEPQEISVEELLGLEKYRETVRSYVQANERELDQLGLSNRSRNRLQKEGYTRLSEIIFLTRQELQSIPALGTSSVAEILSVFGAYMDEHHQRLVAVCRGDETALWDGAVIRDRLLAEYRKVGFGGLSLSEMVQRLQLPEGAAQAQLKKTVGGMLADGELEYVDYRCYRRCKPFSEYLELCPAIKERSREMLRQRLQGETLEAIAQENDLTRERVRQIIKSDVEKVRKHYQAQTGQIHFDEDYYRHFYETYELDKKEGETWLGIGLPVFRYLEMMDVKHGRKDLLEALDDRELDVGLRLKIKNYLNRDKLFVNGMWIEKKRADLEEYVVRNFCAEDVTFEQFSQIFNDFLRREGVEDEHLYYNDIGLRGRRNRLADGRFLLWKQNETLRYYDIEGRDFTELLDTLDLDAYENVEISTVKFMENYPEIMEKYDIRNQYELHNLLRKIVPEGSYHDFHCGRMPEIKFGEFDRTQAILALMADHAPISPTDLAEIVHREYGYERGLILNIYFQPLSPYYHQGSYSVDHKLMPEENGRVLLQLLTDDFYYITEIRRIYADRFPLSDPEEVNSYTLKMLGFTVLSRYALRRHQSLEACFRDILTRQDVLDIAPYRRRFVYVQGFTQVLSELKREREVVEFAPDQIIHLRKLEKAGVGKDELCAFCDQVYDYVADGTYFSAKSLRQSGFTSPLYDLGFSDRFYADLLAADPRFSSARMFSVVMLYTGSEKLSIRSFELERVRAHGSIDVYDLMTELSDVYGCQPGDKFDVIYKLDGTEVHHDKILDRLYANAELYYKELDDMEGI